MNKCLYYLQFLFLTVYRMLLTCISPACAHSPVLAPKAPVNRLTHFRVIGTSVTVTRSALCAPAVTSKKTMLIGIIIVTTIYGTNAVFLRSLSETT